MAWVTQGIVASATELSRLSVPICAASSLSPSSPADSNGRGEARRVSFLDAIEGIVREVAVLSPAASELFGNGEEGSRKSNANRSSSSSSCAANFLAVRELYSVSQVLALRVALAVQLFRFCEALEEALDRYESHARERRLQTENKRRGEREGEGREANTAKGLAHTSSLSLLYKDLFQALVEDRAACLSSFLASERRVAVLSGASTASSSGDNSSAFGASFATFSQLKREANAADDNDGDNGLVNDKTTTAQQHSHHKKGAPILSSTICMPLPPPSASSSSHHADTNDPPSFLSAEAILLQQLAERLSVCVPTERSRSSVASYVYGELTAMLGTEVMGAVGGDDAAMGSSFERQQMSSVHPLLRIVSSASSTVYIRDNVLLMLPQSQISPQQQSHDVSMTMMMNAAHHNSTQRFEGSQHGPHDKERGGEGAPSSFATKEDIMAFLNAEEDDERVGMLPLSHIATVFGYAHFGFLLSQLETVHTILLKRRGKHAADFSNSNSNTFLKIPALCDCYPQQVSPLRLCPLTYRGSVTAAKGGGSGWWGGVGSLHAPSSTAAAAALLLFASHNDDPTRTRTTAGPNASNGDGGDGNEKPNVNAAVEDDDDALIANEREEAKEEDPDSRALRSTQVFLNASQAEQDEMLALVSSCRNSIVNISTTTATAASQPLLFSRHHGNSDGSGRFFGAPHTIQQRLTVDALRLHCLTQPPIPKPSNRNNGNDGVIDGSETVYSDSAAAELAAKEKADRAKAGGGEGGEEGRAMNRFASFQSSGGRRSLNDDDVLANDAAMSAEEGDEAAIVIRRKAKESAQPPPIMTTSLLGQKRARGVSTATSAATSETSQSHRYNNINKNLGRRHTTGAPLTTQQQQQRERRHRYDSSAASASSAAHNRNNQNSRSRKHHHSSATNTNTNTTTQQTSRQRRGGGVFNNNKKRPSSNSNASKSHKKSVKSYASKFRYSDGRSGTTMQDYDDATNVTLAVPEVLRSAMDGGVQASIEHIVISQAMLVEEMAWQLREARARCAMMGGGGGGGDGGAAEEARRLLSLTSPPPQQQQQQQQQQLSQYRPIIERLIGKSTTAEDEEGGGDGGGDASSVFAPSPLRQLLVEHYKQTLPFSLDSVMDELKDREHALVAFIKNARTVFESKAAAVRALHEKRQKQKQVAADGGNENSNLELNRSINSDSASAAFPSSPSSSFPPLNRLLAVLEVQMLGSICEAALRHNREASSSSHASANVNDTHWDLSAGDRHCVAEAVRQSPQMLMPPSPSSFLSSTTTAASSNPLQAIRTALAAFNHSCDAILRRVAVADMDIDPTDDYNRNNGDNSNGSNGRVGGRGGADAIDAEGWDLNEPIEGFDADEGEGEDGGADGDCGTEFNNPFSGGGGGGMFSSITSSSQFLFGGSSNGHFMSTQQYSSQDPSSFSGAGYGAAATNAAEKKRASRREYLLSLPIAERRRLRQKQLLEKDPHVASSLRYILNILLGPHFFNVAATPAVINTAAAVQILAKEALLRLNHNGNNASAAVTASAAPFASSAALTSPSSFTLSFAVVSCVACETVLSVPIPLPNDAMNRHHATMSFTLQQHVLHHASSARHRQQARLMGVPEVTRALMIPQRYVPYYGYVNNDRGTLVNKRLMSAGAGKIGGGGGLAAAADTAASYDGVGTHTTLHVNGIATLMPIRPPMSLGAAAMASSAAAGAMPSMLASSFVGGGGEEPSSHASSEAMYSAVVSCNNTNSRACSSEMAHHGGAVHKKSRRGGGDTALHPLTAALRRQQGKHWCEGRGRDMEKKAFFAYATGSDGLDLARHFDWRRTFSSPTLNAAPSSSQPPSTQQQFPPSSSSAPTAPTMLVALAADPLVTRFMCKLIGLFAKLRQAGRIAGQLQRHTRSDSTLTEAIVEGFSGGGGEQEKKRRKRRGNEAKSKQREEGEEDLQRPTTAVDLTNEDAGCRDVVSVSSSHAADSNAEGQQQPQQQESYFRSVLSVTHPKLLTDGVEVVEGWRRGVAGGDNNVNADLSFEDEGFGGGVEGEEDGTYDNAHANSRASRLPTAVWSPLSALLSFTVNTFAAAFSGGEAVPQWLLRCNGENIAAELNRIAMHVRRLRLPHDASPLVIAASNNDEGKTDVTSFNNTTRAAAAADVKRKIKSVAAFFKIKTEARDEDDNDADCATNGNYSQNQHNRRRQHHHNQQPLLRLVRFALTDVQSSSIALNRFIAANHAYSGMINDFVNKMVFKSALAVESLKAGMERLRPCVRDTYRQRITVQMKRVVMPSSSAAAAAGKGKKGGQINAAEGDDELFDHVTFVTLAGYQDILGDTHYSSSARHEKMNRRRKHHGSDDADDHSSASSSSNSTDASSSSDDDDDDAGAKHTGTRLLHRHTALLRYRHSVACLRYVIEALSSIVKEAAGFWEEAKRKLSALVYQLHVRQCAELGLLPTPTTSTASLSSTTTIWGSASYQPSVKFMLRQHEEKLKLMTEITNLLLASATVMSTTFDGLGAFFRCNSAEVFAKPISVHIPAECTIGKWSASGPREPAPTVFRLAMEPVRRESAPFLKQLEDDEDDDEEEDDNVVTS